MSAKHAHEHIEGRSNIDAPLLTEEERIQFVRDGYLTKHVLDDEAADRCLAITWESLEAKQIRPDNPAAWKSHPYLRPHKGVVKLRDEVAGNEELHQILAQNPLINSVVRDLMGDGVSGEVRGIYPTFPTSRLASRPYSAHYELHDVQVFVMVYLEDVMPAGGGLLIWPGSHRAAYSQFAAKFANEPGPGFDRIFQRFNLSRPFDFVGKKGDAAFCHHRVLHSSSNNFTKSPRMGALVDFIGARHAELKHQTPGEDLWEDWSEALHKTGQSLPASISTLTTGAPVRAALIRLRRLLRQLSGKRTSEY